MNWGQDRSNFISITKLVHRRIHHSTINQQTPTSMAASHRLVIAKAQFSAALLQQDEVCAPLLREDIARFHSSLEATVQRCSPSNVEV
jgi:hypothetical protein